MIQINIEGNRYQPPKLTTYPVTTSTPKNTAEIRDNIIKEAAKKCPYKVGDIVEPVNAESFAKYGQCYVQHIAQTYVQYGKDVEWPAHNNPLIVCAIAAGGDAFFATTNYFKKV